MAVSTMSRPAMHVFILGERLYHVNVPTRREAAVAVSQVRDAGVAYLSADSMRARPTSHIDGNNPTTVALELLRQSPEAQELVADVVSDPNVFYTISRCFRESPFFQTIVQSVTSCISPSDRLLPAGDDETSSLADRPSWWGRMSRMVVDAVSSLWNQLMDLFASAIPRIQAASAWATSEDTNALVTAKIITGLVVLVTMVIIVGAILVL